PRLHLRQTDLADSRPRSGRQKPQIIGDLPETDGHGAENSARLDDGVQGVLRLEVVVRLADIDARQFVESGAGPGRELGMRVDPGAYCRTAKSNLRKLSLRVSEAADGTLGLAGIAEEFLAEAYGRGVLEVRAPGFYDGHELRGLRQELELQPFK